MPNMPDGAELAALAKRFPGTKIVTAPAAPEGDDARALPDLGGGLVEADGRTRGEDLVGLVLCLRPLGLVEVSTQYGDKLATNTYIVEVVDRTAPGAEPGGEPYVDHGQVSLIWQHVRGALGKTNAENPWIVGTIVRRTKAYFLNPCSPEQAKLARYALGCFLADRTDQEGASS